MKKLKKIIKRHIPIIGYYLNELICMRFTILPFRYNFTHDKRILNIIKKYLTKRNGIFVEAGAADGLSQSNTAWLSKYMGWTGVLVEPIPHRFVKCLENR